MVYLVAVSSPGAGQFSRLFLASSSVSYATTWKGVTKTSAHREATYGMLYACFEV